MTPIHRTLYIWSYCYTQRYIFPTVFAKMSCMMNPLLYGLTNSSLRRELRHLWQDMCCQRKVNVGDRHCRYRNRRFHIITIITINIFPAKFQSMRLCDPHH